MNKKLIALYPILYEARQYNVGDELPVNNTLMVEKWLSANTAEWRIVEPETEFNKEYYENIIAELKENHKNEIAELKEKHASEIKAFEEKDLEKNQNVQEKTSVSDTKNKKVSSKTK